MQAGKSAAPSRTSESCYLSKTSQSWFHQKIALLTGKAPSTHEPAQVARYQGGQFYLAHFDAFDVTTGPGRECALTGKQAQMHRDSTRSGSFDVGSPAFDCESACNCTRRRCHECVCRNAGSNFRNYAVFHTCCVLHPLLHAHAVPHTVVVDAHTHTHTACHVYAAGGQRVGTVLVYLTTVREGGGTYFPRIDKRFLPVQGNAVIFFPTTIGTSFMERLRSGQLAASAQCWTLSAVCACVSL